MNAFGKEIINKQNIIANFGGREHSIKFNNEYIEFLLTRKSENFV
jgi:hypothetical protein